MVFIWKHIQGFPLCQRAPYSRGAKSQREHACCRHFRHLQDTEYYGLCVLSWASFMDFESILSSKGVYGDLCCLLYPTQSSSLSSLNKVGLCTVSQAPNLTQSLSLPSAWGSHMHISWFLAHFLLIWHPAMHPSAAYIISISGKNVPERGMCPWAVLYSWWFYLSYLISPPGPHRTSLRTQATPFILLWLPTRPRTEPGKQQSLRKYLLNEWNNWIQCF